MTDSKPDSDFRAFSKQRGTQREIWFRVYWGLWWIPVHAKGYLLPLVPFAFAVAWGSLLSWLGLISYPMISLIPNLIVFAVVIILAFLHSESG